MATPSLRILLLLFATTAIPATFTEALWQIPGRPIPPGQTAANNATRQAEKVEPPAPPPAKTVTAAQVLQQADELVSLAQQVRIETQHATEGVLDKDLKDKLKRIEKLSKNLRGELAL
jgi:hypothetical protein